MATVQKVIETRQQMQELIDKNTQELKVILQEGKIHSFEVEHKMKMLTGCKWSLTTRLQTIRESISPTCF